MLYNLTPEIDGSVYGNSIVDPYRVIGNWYDLLLDPFQVIKDKCKPTQPSEGIEYKIETVCYLSSEFSKDKIDSPSFASPDDKILNNIILDSEGRLLQLYFATRKEERGSLGGDFFKVVVTEYKVSGQVIARKFESYLS